MSWVRFDPDDEATWPPGNVMVQGWTEAAGYELLTLDTTGSDEDALPILKQADGPSWTGWFGWQPVRDKPGPVLWQPLEEPDRSLLDTPTPAGEIDEGFIEMSEQADGSFAPVES
jgi:hypothetical protein